MPLPLLPASEVTQLTVCKRPNAIRSLPNSFQPFVFRSAGLVVFPLAPDPFDQRLTFHQEFDDVGFKVDSAAADRLASASAFLNASFSTESEG